MLLRSLERREAQELRGALPAAGKQFPGDRRVDQPRPGAAGLRAHRVRRIGKSEDASQSARKLPRTRLSCLPRRRLASSSPCLIFRFTFNFPAAWFSSVSAASARACCRSCCVTSASSPSASPSSPRTRRASARPRSTASSSSSTRSRATTTARCSSRCSARGDFLLNLSVDVSSIALIKLAHEKGALYLDTCIEPWPGGYTDPSISPARRTNYALREEALALRQSHKNGPTAVLTHGANPGLVSHFVKQALLNLAADTGVDAGNPSTREQWAALAAQAAA